MIIKPRMNLLERYKVKKNIKRIFNSNIFYKEFCKRQFKYVYKFTLDTAPESLKHLCAGKKIFLNETHKIYVLFSNYDIPKVITVYNDTNRIISLDERITDDLLDIAIAIIESKAMIKRLIDKKFLK